MPTVLWETLRCCISHYITLSNEQINKSFKPTSIPNKLWVKISSTEKTHQTRPILIPSTHTKILIPSVVALQILSFSQNFGPLDWRPGPVKVAQKNKNTPTLRASPRQTPHPNHKIFLNRNQETCRIRRGF